MRAIKTIKVRLNKKADHPKGWEGDPTQDSAEGCYYYGHEVFNLEILDGIVYDTWIIEYYTKES